MAQAPQVSKLEDISVDDINDTYRKGYITTAQKNDIMRRKAESEVKRIIGDESVLSAVMKRTVKKLQEGWDDIKEGVSQSKGDLSLNTAKQSFKIMWGEIQILTSAMNAVGEVVGAHAEMMALRAGASPGLAKVIGVAADVASGVVPVGGIVRSGVKGAQPLARKALGKGAAKAAGQEAAEATAKQAAKAAEGLIDDTIKAGLKADGVQGLERFVQEGGDILKPIKAATEELSTRDKFVQALNKYRGEMKQITETKTHEMTLAEADKLGIHLDDIRSWVPGKAMTEAEMAAGLKALDEPVNDLVSLAKKGLAGDDDALDAMAKLLTEDFFEYSPKFRGAEVTAGRSVEILKETPPMKAITDLLMGWDPESLAKGDFREALKTIAEDLVEIEPAKLKALQIMGAKEGIKEGATYWQQIREGYVNLLLARPVTQVRNFLGNVYAAANSGIERELGGWLSIDKNAGLVKGEGLAEFRGMFAGLTDGLKGFADAYKKFDPDDLSKLDFVPHKIPGPLGRIINLPGDTMRGMDNFFKVLLKRGDYYAQARNLGVHQGLTGEALEDYVTRRVNMPSKAMMEHAKDFADYNTFANDLGTYGKMAQKAAQAGPFALYFPFMKTPMNLSKYVWNRAPGLQLLSYSLWDDIAAGGTRADQAIGRLTLSNLTGMFWYGLAQQGVVTGGGPADPTLRNSWLATKQPYSIKGGDRWYPLTNLEPATAPMALMADFAEIHNQLDEPNAGQAGMALGLAGVRDIVDKTYWQSVGDIVDFLGAVRVGQEPSKRALSILAGPAITAASGGPVGAAIARAFDPIRRETRSLLDDWRARVPGFSKELPPMRDIVGDPILPPQSVGHKWLSMVSPLSFKDFETDPVKQEASKLSVRLPKFPWALGGGRIADDFDVRSAQPGDLLPVELTPKERDRWQVIYKNILRHKENGIEARLLNSDAYKNAPYARKRDMFMNFLAEARAGAQAALIAENVELGKKVIRNKAARYLPLLQPDQRQAAEEQIESNVEAFSSQAPGAVDNLLKWGYLEQESEGQ